MSSSQISTTDGGYTCAACGQWVVFGAWHNCPAWNQQIIPYQQPMWGWWPSMNNPVKNFKGAIKDLTALPKDATVGDCFYVQELDSLMTRVTEGWLLNVAEERC